MLNYSKSDVVLVWLWTKKLTSCEPALLDLMPTSDRARVCSVGTRDGHMGDFHSQGFKVNVSAHCLIVETIVGVC